MSTADRSAGGLYHRQVHGEAGQPGLGPWSPRFGRGAGSLRPVGQVGRANFRPPARAASFIYGCESLGRLKHRRRLPDGRHAVHRWTRVPHPGRVGGGARLSPAEALGPSPNSDLSRLLAGSDPHRPDFDGYGTIDGCVPHPLSRSILFRLRRRRSPNLRLPHACCPHGHRRCHGELFRVQQRPSFTSARSARIGRC